MKKKVLSLVTSAVVAFTMIFGTAAMTFADEQKVEATVTVRAQMGNAFLHGIKSVKVSSDLAESYGYTDNVPQAENVSALDVMVQSHIMTFGDDFSKDTASDYLKADDYGYVSKLYGYETFANGFIVNEGYPNDGTKSSWGGYNGTTVSTQKIVNGDTVDFYVYNDESYYSDSFSYISVDSKVSAGAKVSAAVKGTMVMNGYLYKDPASMKAAAEALQGVGIAYVDLSSGSITSAGESVSDENGAVSFTAPKKTGTYYITAYSQDSGVPVLMNPVKISVEASFGSASLSKTSYTYTGKARKPSVTVKNSLGAKLTNNKDYTVSYKNNTKIGTAAVTIKGKGSYSFTKTLKFKINPAGTKLVKVKALGSNRIKVSWKKQKTKTTGYQIRYSAHKNMSSSKTVTIKKNTVTWKNIWHVAKGTKYVQIRTYKTVGGTKYYSSWSAAKSVRVK